MQALSPVRKLFQNLKRLWEEGREVKRTTQEQKGLPMWYTSLRMVLIVALESIRYKIRSQITRRPTINLVSKQLPR